MNSALLTIDLTKAVADEAIERGDSIIVAYRTLALPTHLYTNKQQARLTLRQA